MAKLSANRSNGYIAKPDSHHIAILLYGPDPTLTADRREALIKVLLGADDDPFRLARLFADAVKKDAASLSDECNAISFGGGDRVIVLTGVTDALTPTIKSAMDQMPGGAVLIVTADALSGGSKLRKLIEGDDRAMALPFYPAEGAALEGEVTAVLRQLGAPPLEGDAARVLGDVLQGVGHGEAMRFAEVLALAAADNDSITAEDIFSIAPPAAEADFEAGIQAVTQGRARDLPGLFDRFEAQAASLPGLVRVLTMHMARLHRAQALMSEGMDVQTAMGKLRPPVFWKTRDSFAAQLRAWPRVGVEDAFAQLAGLEGTLRSGSAIPERALIERTLMRIAMTAPGARR